MNWNLKFTDFMVLGCIQLGHKGIQRRRDGASRHGAGAWCWKRKYISLSWSESWLVDNVCVAVINVPDVFGGLLSLAYWALIYQGHFTVSLDVIESTALKCLICFLFFCFFVLGTWILATKKCNTARLQSCNICLWTCLTCVKSWKILTNVCFDMCLSLCKYIYLTFHFSKNSARLSLKHLVTHPFVLLFRD